MRKTVEQQEWIIKNKDFYKNYNQLTDEFNKKFGTNIKMSSIYNFLRCKGLIEIQKVGKITIGNVGQEDGIVDGQMRVENTKESILFVTVILLQQVSGVHMKINHITNKVKCCIHRIDIGGNLLFIHIIVEQGLLSRWGKRKCSYDSRGEREENTVFMLLCGIVDGKSIGS